MSIITDYISQVKSIIEKLPCVLSNELIIDNRGDVVLYLKGIIVFTNQSELHKHEGDKIFSAEELSLNKVLELIIDLIK